MTDSGNIEYTKYGSSNKNIGFDSSSKRQQNAQINLNSFNHLSPHAQKVFFTKEFLLKTYSQFLC